jgi:mono/diheme cytochrome c family protein
MIRIPELKILLHPHCYFCAMKWLLASILVWLASCNNPSQTPAPPTVDNTPQFEEGKAIFFARCASCHMVNKEMTGPALRGVEKRWPDKKKLYAFIRNSEDFLKTDTYAHTLWLQYNQTMMTKHPDLTDAQIDQVLGYINSVSVNP